MYFLESVHRVELHGSAFSMARLDDMHVCIQNWEGQLSIANQDIVLATAPIPSFGLPGVLKAINTQAMVIVTQGSSIYGLRLNMLYF